MMCVSVSVSVCVFQIDTDTVVASSPGYDFVGSSNCRMMFLPKLCSIGAFNPALVSYHLDWFTKSCTRPVSLFPPLWSRLKYLNNCWMD